MHPTLSEGAIVLARRKKPQKGDIVIARAQGREVIKRVAHISPAQLYLLGDNSAHSTDSRQYGPVTNNDIIGVVWLTFKNRFIK
jgi:type IV secretory pathway protease TraF